MVLILSTDWQAEVTSERRRPIQGLRRAAALPPPQHRQPSAGQLSPSSREGPLSSSLGFGARACEKPTPFWPSVHFVALGKGCFSLTKNNWNAYPAVCL